MRAHLSGLVWNGTGRGKVGRSHEAEGFGALLFEMGNRRGGAPGLNVSSDEVHRPGDPHLRRGEKAPLEAERCGEPVPERYEEQAAAAAMDAE
jgi:hypothetical protein